MNIEGLSMALAQNKALTDVSTKVLSMSLDQFEESGAEMIDMMNRSMMENSVNPNIGGNIDIMI